MVKYLVISIDVEPDCSPSWRYSSPLRFRGISEGIAKRLQPLFNKYDMAPTYLINNVVLEDDESCEVLKRLPGRFELGTHLHPEFMEPEKTEFDYAGKKAEANCCFLPPQIEAKKIENITRLFSDRFDRQPMSFRAGRFSAGPNTIASLARLNYKVDTSVTPHVIWDDKSREQPVDYSNAAEQPYFIKQNSLLDEDSEGGMLQVPVTIANRRTSILRELKRTYLGLRHPIQPVRPVWLRPVFSNLNAFISLVEEYSEKYKNNPVLILNMMFHNVEVLPGLSPYTKSESDCANYLTQLERFFRFCRTQDIQGITLEDVYSLYR